MEFEVGDIVEAFGVRGVVEGNALDESIQVRFGTHVTYFYPDGKAALWHATPSLKLIERPRKTKKVKVWVNCGFIGSYPYPSVYTHFSEEDARECALTDMVTQEIEVEVLDE